MSPPLPVTCSRCTNQSFAGTSLRHTRSCFRQTCLWPELERRTPEGSAQTGRPRAAAGWGRRLGTQAASSDANGEDAWLLLCFKGSTCSDNTGDRVRTREPSWTACTDSRANPWNVGAPGMWGPRGQGPKLTHKVGSQPLAERPSVPLRRPGRGHRCCKTAKRLPVRRALPAHDPSPPPAGPSQGHCDGGGRPDRDEEEALLTATARPGRREGPGERPDRELRRRSDRAQGNLPLSTARARATAEGPRVQTVRARRRAHSCAAPNAVAAGPLTGR